MGSDGTFGYLIGKVEVLRVECAPGRDGVAKLVADRGPDASLTDWLSERTKDCPQRACHLLYSVISARLARFARS